MQYNQVTERFSIQTARMLDRMASIDERRSSLLDNSLVLFGSGMKDGNAHESVNVPTALFGNPGGKLETGRHIQCKEGSKLAQFTPIHPYSPASPSSISAPQDQHNSKLPGFFSPQPEQSISTSLCSASRSAVSFMSCIARS